MNMIAKSLSILVLLLGSYTVSVSCQEESSLVYFGTGVNGSHDRSTLNNHTVVLGGLFSIYTSENNICARVNPHMSAIQYVEAMVLAVDKINHDKNILPGVTLAYEIRDTCLLPNHALEQTLSFVTARLKTLEDGTMFVGVSGVVGTTFSSVSTAVASLLRLFKIPQVSYSATAEVLSDKSRFDYFLRTVPPDSLQARAIAAIIINFNWTYVVAIHSDDDYGNGGIETLQTELRISSPHICIASVMAVSDSATSKDYDQIVERINQEWVANSSVVILFGHPSNAEGIFEAVLQRQRSDAVFAKRNITWIGSDSWGDDVLPKYNKIAQGLLSTIPRVHLSDSFDEHFLSLHPSNNGANPWFNEYWEEIFNCSLVGQTGVEGCDLDNQIQSRENGSYDQNSFVSFVIDAVYAFAHAIHDMQQDLCPDSRGLCPEILETQLKETAINGELLLQYIRNVSFNGTSAERIQFDENGDQQGGYDIMNLQVDSDGKFSYVTVGKWDEFPTERKMSLLIYDNIQWKHSFNSSDVPESICSQPCDGGEYSQPVVNQAECCWTCKQCAGARQVSDGFKCRECELGFRPSEDKSHCVDIQPSFLMWSDPLAIIIIILALFGIAATSFVAIVFVVYRNKHLVKASSRELSAVLLCGIMLCYLIPFIYIAKPSPTTCAVRRFGVGFCFSLCFSALLIKTNRIHRIFNRGSVSVQAPPLISPQSQLFFTASLVAIQVVIATVWLVVEQPSTVFMYYDHLTSDLVCGENPYLGLSVTLAYNVLLLAVTTYFAFRTRKVPQNFNEAKFINLTVYTLCILWLAFIPTYFVTTALRTSFQTGSLVIAIILSATVTLCCLLVPKVYFLFSNKKEESDENHTITLDAFGNSKKQISSSSVLHNQGHPSNRSDRVDVSVQTDTLE